MHGPPYWLIKAMCSSHFKSFLPQPRYPPEAAGIVAHYYALMVQRHGNAEIAALKSCHYFSFPIHSMHETDRMMNPEIDFPVAFCFGDRDFFGTEGADAIVEANRHFESGRS